MSLNAQRVSFFGGLLAFENLFFSPYDMMMKLVFCIVSGVEREKQGVATKSEEEAMVL